MDQEMLVPKQQSGTKFLTRKNILVVFVLVILVEIGWAGWTLFKSTLQDTQKQASSAKLKQTIISLASDVTSLKVGSKTTVSVNVSSVKSADGVDLIITYDPKLLSVETTGGQPVIAGTIFSDYPQNVLDPALGRITVSGISSQTGGVLANGLFGSIVFVGIAPGQAKILVEYVPSSTTDSNVIESKTGKDVLEGVNNLLINVTP